MIFSIRKRISWNQKSWICQRQSWIWPRPNGELRQSRGTTLLGAYAGLCGAAATSNRPKRSSLVAVGGWSGSCGPSWQVWPWMPRRESSVEHRRSHLLRCKCSDEWPRKCLLIWVKKQINGGFIHWNDFRPYQTFIWTYCYQFVLLFMVGLASISWATWQGWGAYCHGQSSWLLSARSWAHQRMRCCRKLQEVFCFFFSQR